MTTSAFPEGQGGTGGTGPEGREYGPYARGARAYRAAGWDPLPTGRMRRDRPPAGWTGEQGSARALPDAQVEAWIRERGGDSLSVRMPPGVVGIDVDCHDGKPGAATLAALEAAYGPLPPTWSSSSRTDGSCIRFYRAGQFAAAALRDLGPGVEVVRPAHRYAAVWPTVSEKTQAVYRWTGPDGQRAGEGTVPRAGELAQLPEAWLGAKAQGGGRRGEGGRYLNPGVDDLLLHGIPADSPRPQDEVLRDLVWKLVSEGRGDPEVQLVWERVVRASPRTRPDEPFGLADFQRHLKGARAKLGGGVPPELLALVRGVRGADAQKAGQAGDTASDPTPQPGPTHPDASLPASVRWRGWPLTWDELAGHTRDQDGMAELLLSLCGRDVAWDAGRQRYLVYRRDRGCWEADGAGHEEVRRRVRQLALEVQGLVEARIPREVPPEALAAAKGPERAELLARAKAVRSWYERFANQGLAGIVKAAQPQARQVCAADFDGACHLLAFPNGTYDVASGRLREHRPGDLLSRCAAAPLDPALADRPLEECAPHFHALLWRMCAAPGEVPPQAHRDRYAALCRWLGYQLHGSNPEKRLGVLEGASDIGKNQVVEIVGAVLGAQMAWLSAKPALLVRSRQERPETEESDLAGRRMVVVNELTESQVLDEGQVVRLVNPEGAALRVRRLYENGVEVPITWKISVTTNELPKARLTEAVRGRLLMFALSGVSVPKEEQYPVKAAILAGELPAVTAHLVAWWRQWYLAAGLAGKGLLEPAEFEARRERYREENVHPAQLFIDECCQVTGHPEDRVAHTEIWEACEAYYRRQHSDMDRRYTGGRRKFFDVLTAQAGVTREERSQGANHPIRLTGFRGIKLSPPPPMTARGLLDRSAQ